MVTDGKVRSIALTIAKAMGGSSQHTMVTSTSEMVNTSKQYILEKTGTIWKYGLHEVDDTDRNLFVPSEATLNQNPDGSERPGSFITGLIPIQIEFADPYIVRITGESARNHKNGMPCIYKLFYYDMDGNELGVRYASGVKYTESEGVYELYAGYFTADEMYNMASSFAYLRFQYTIQGTEITASDIPTDITISTPEPKTRLEIGWYDTGVAYGLDAALKETVALHDQALGAVDQRMEQWVNQWDTKFPAPPDYWIDAVDALTDDIMAKQNAAGSDAFIFIWLSDLHGISGHDNGDNYAIKGKSETSHIGTVAAYAAEKFQIPFVVISGDIMSQASHQTEEKVWAEYRSINQLLSPIPLEKLLCIKGNHDGAWGITDTGEYYMNNIGSAKIYNALYRRQALDSRRVFGKNGTYFYIDHASGVRMIFLNSHTDGDSSQQENGTATYNPFRNFVYGQEQLEWLCQALSSLPKGYDAIIFCHVPMSEEKSMDGSLLEGILSAFNARATYAQSVAISSDTWGTNNDDDTYKAFSIHADFTNAQGEIIALFHGHKHCDTLDSTSHSFPCIGITTAGGDVRDENPVKRVGGTVTETAMDIVTIDRRTRRIYCNRLGAGSDREIAY